MRATIKLVDVDRSVAELTIRMPVGEWKRLTGQLKNEYPSWALCDVISKLVLKAETHFEEDTTEVVP